ncbi:hypothetical protein [Streptomyces sp. NPDC057740]|uniref:hypothetical protein n=1 Tax=Streptomyces sp. NPDC057740 TaxID=3346234 RepID=UPI0036D070F4
MRDGLPEVTPDLVRVVLLEALPQFLPASACAEGAALEVLRVLGDRTRADGRLNARGLHGCGKRSMPVPGSTRG